MALRAEQNPRPSESVQSPRRGWVRRDPAEGGYPRSELGPSLSDLIAAGPEPRATATVPIGCPLPIGDLASYVAEAGQDLACVDCHFYRTLDRGPGGAPPRGDAPRVRYGFCCAPEREGMRLVSVDQVGSTTRPETDSRVLACVRSGMTAAATISAATGLGERVVWKAVARLKGEGVLPRSTRISRS